MSNPNLFGVGIGISTCGDFTCEMCGTEYNKGNDENEDYSGESVIYTDFAGIEVCFNCFEKVEKEIFKRMPDIISWYKLILNKQFNETSKNLDLINEIK